MANREKRPEEVLFQNLSPEDYAKTMQSVQSLDTASKEYKKGVGKLVHGAGSSLMNKSSIIGMAKSNLFEFPVFISDTVPMEFATAVNTLLEQVYASYLQMAVSISPVVDANIAKSGPFSKYKTNVTKYIECTELPYQHDACHAIYKTDEHIIEYSMIGITDAEASVLLEAMDHQPLDEFSHYFTEARNPKWNPSQSSDWDKYSEEERKVIMDTWKGMRDAETMSELAKANKIQEEADKIAGDSKRSESDRQKAEELSQRIEDARNEIVRAYNGNSTPNAAIRNTPEYKKLKYELQKGELTVKKLGADLEHSIQKEERDAEKHLHDTKIKSPQFIDESKINKLNTMKPLMMTVNLSVVDKYGGVSRPIEYVVGVKTHCRIVDSSTLPDVVSYPLKEMDRLSRKAKWRAGELKFMKDIVFHIKEKKQTAIDSRDPKRRWYRKLYELAHMKGDSSTARKITGQLSSGGLIPNVTMVISKSDVDFIEDRTGIDMLSASKAKEFCRELFMMGLIVIDTDSQSIKILIPDISGDYEVQSLASVNKQLAQLDSASDMTREIFKSLR